MAGLFMLFLFFLLVAVMFMHYRYERKNKQKSFPLKSLLLGYNFSKDSPWKSSSMTKETSESPLEAIGESPDQELLDKIFLPPTDEGMEKKDIGTIVVEGDSPTYGDVEKKEFVAKIVEDANPTDEDVERDVGGKITYVEFQKLLLLADRLSSNSAPRKSEYGRGYHMGIQIHFNNAYRGSLPDHYSVAEIARRNGCRNVHAFSRGYRDGLMGLKPEYTN